MASKANRVLFQAARMLSILSFAASLFLPAFTAAEKYLGFYCLLFGYFAVLDFHFAWFANPLLFLSWRCTYNNQAPVAAVAFSAAALVVALSFMGYKTLGVAGTGFKPIYIHIGYYAWLASMLLQVYSALVGASIKDLTTRSRPTSQAAPEPRP